MNGEIRVGEMFAGIGGFRLGLERANHNECSCFSKEPEQENSEQGRKWITSEQTTQFRSGSHTAFRVIWANEIDKYACQIYRKNFGEKELIESDIREVKPDTIPDIDLLTGGFPCQSFSVAGKREGFSDIRGTMFFEIARIAEAKRPQLLLLENVKGLLSAQNGYCFWRILSVLDELGYNVEWKVLNSKHYGVPQNRERVFIIGHLRGTGRSQIFPLRESSKILGKEPESKDICPTVTSRYYKRGKTDPYIAILRDNLGGNIKDRVRENGDAWTLGGSETLVAQALQTDGFLRSGSSFGTDKPQSARNIRRLTPTECERLQGFPDNWTQGVSDTQRYKLLGNAVTVNVIEHLGKLIAPWHRLMDGNRHDLFTEKSSTKNILLKNR